ncbi:helix-turn-helix domain-containing protein [Bacillus tropicus]|uniref:helix-turn-helix domain-containing protein n=1 Tax=Bacillus tropicus TaxID=2026188 RepID=UPI002DB7628C|nr:helix-turn-helix domain-containing protein [Bacillus tropicus]MEC2928200.1 helix-turn-helix domain-containing protein [Bacillus tropicus]
MEKKKGITIIAGNETYENLSTFKTIKELNDTVRTYKEKFADQLNKNQLAVLNHLHNHSAKFFGVSFKTKKKIAEALEISRRTVIRVCLRLESLGIIKQLEMKRKIDMRQTCNAIVIQPIIVEEQIVTPEPAKNDDFCHTNKTTTISLKQKIKDINIRNSNESQSNVNDNDFIDYRVPQSMRMKLATAFDSNVINESFSNALNIAKKAAKKFSLLSDKDVFNNILANASVALFSKTHEVEHNGELMKNPIGYFTNTFKSMVYNYIDSFKKIHNLANRKPSACTNDGIFYNWLEVDGSKIPSTKTIDNPFTPGVYYKISKEEADEMGLY